MKLGLQLALLFTSGLFVLGLVLLKSLNAPRDKEVRDGLTESVAALPSIVGRFDQQFQTLSRTVPQETHPDATRRGVLPTPLPDGVDMREVILPSFPSVEGVTNLQPGQLPEQIELQLQNSEGPGPANVLAMGRELKNGPRTPQGDHMELILRSEIAAEPEAVGLIHSATCAAGLCELQILDNSLSENQRPASNVVNARLDMVERIVSRNPAFRASYRPRRGMTIRTQQGYFQVWYWSERR